MNVLPILTVAGSASSALASLPGSPSDAGAPSLFSTFVMESSHLKPATQMTPSAAPANGLSSSEFLPNTQATTAQPIHTLAAASTLAEILQGSLFSPRPDERALVPFLTAGQVGSRAPAIDVLSSTLLAQAKMETAPGQIGQMGANAPAPSVGPQPPSLPAFPAQAKAETAPGQVWQMGADAPPPSLGPPHPSLPPLPGNAKAEAAPGQVWQMGADAPSPSMVPPQPSLPPLPGNAKAEAAPGPLWQMGADAPAPSMVPPQPSLPPLPGNAKAEAAPGPLWQMGADAPAPSVVPPQPSLPPLPGNAGAETVPAISAQVISQAPATAPPHPSLPVQAKAETVPAASKPMLAQAPTAPNAPLTTPTGDQAPAVASTPTPLPAEPAPAEPSALQDQDGATSEVVGTDQSTMSKAAPTATDIPPAAPDARPAAHPPLASPALASATLGSAGVVPANVMPAHQAGSAGSSQADGATQALESSKADRNAVPSPSADGNKQGATGNGTDQNGPRTQLPASALRASEAEPTTTNAASQIPRPSNPTASAPIAHAEPAAAAAPALQANILGTTQMSSPQLPGDVSSFAAGINGMAGGETAPLRLLLSPPTPAASASNMEAMAMRIAHRSSMGESRFDIRLDPPELGRIQVRLEVDPRGQTQVQLSADRPQTLELLQRDSSMLERALRNAGFELSGGLNFSLGREGRQASEQGAEHMPDHYARIDAVSDSELTPSAAFAQWSGRTIGEVGHLDIRI